MFLMNFDEFDDLKFETSKFDNNKTRRCIDD